MSIELVCAAIKTVVDGLSPVAAGATETYDLKGFNPPPAKADTAQLPGVWTFTGPATYIDGADWLTEERTYLVQCAVLPVGQGTPAEREQRCRPLLVALRAALIAHPHLGVAFVQRTRLLGDSGITVLPEYDGAFIGFELRLGVTEIVARSYAASE